MTSIITFALSNTAYAGSDGEQGSIKNIIDFTSYMKIDPSILNYYQASNVELRIQLGADAQDLPLSEKEICHLALNKVTKDLQDKSVKVWGCKQGTRPPSDETIVITLKIKKIFTEGYAQKLTQDYYELQSIITKQKKTPPHLSGRTTFLPKGPNETLFLKDLERLIIGTVQSIGIRHITKPMQ